MNGDAILPSLVSVEGPVFLHECDWFQRLMTQWDGGTGQADAAEFLHLLMSLLNHISIDCRWEKRMAVEKDGVNVVRVMDRGSRHSPIVMQVPGDWLADPRIPFSALMRSWCQDWGMATSMLAWSECIVVHIDRFKQAPDGRVTKIVNEITGCELCSFPVFSYGLVISGFCLDYVLTAAMIHHGHERSGHYQAVLRVGSPSSAEISQWLLTDDNKPTQYIEDWQPWMAANVTVLCFTRRDATFLKLTDPEIDTDEEDMSDACNPATSTESGAGMQQILTMLTS
eukprot:Skav231106  [mRNA]  locus=scaffold2525:482172:483020:- [translate_table: standard]